MRCPRPVLAVLLLALVGVLPASGQSGGGVTETSDTLSIVKEGSAPSNADIAIALLEATPLQPERVLVGRDDEFVDSMASGVLQSDSPLLLVPPDGPVPGNVMAALAGTGAARVTLLGGEAALTPAVRQAFVDAGFAVDRHEGASRFETAVAIAEDAPPADTAILVRAFAAEGATDPTQAFADSLGAGFLSAENGWPILLTQTEVLSGPTRAYIAASSFSRVLVLGGTAAVSEAVVAEVSAMVPSVDRIAGSDRFTTGVEIAKEAGAQSAADVARVTLVEAQAGSAWAGGFAAAAHAALFDAPIVYTTSTTVPPSTQAWLEGQGFARTGERMVDQGGSDQGRYAQAGPGGIRLTCVTPSVACQRAREILALPPVIDVTIDPPSGAAVAPGDVVTADVRGASGVGVTGSCVSGPMTLPDDGRVTLAQVPCTLVLRLQLPGGTMQTETASYLAAESGLTVLSAGADGQAVGGRWADISADGLAVAFLSDGAVLPGAGGVMHTYLRRPDGVRAVDVRPDGGPSGGISGVVTSTEDRPRVSHDGRFVLFSATDRGLDVDGLTGAAGRNLYVRDTQTDQTRLASLDASGSPVRDPRMGDIDAAGRAVTFVGEGQGSAGSSTSTFLMIRDTVAGTTDIVRDHQMQPLLSFEPANVAISGDGTHVVFTSSRPEIVADDTNARPDVFVFRRGDRAVARVSVDSQGVQSVGETAGSDSQIAVSFSGTQVAFISAASNLAPGGSAGNDVFVHDLSTGTTTLISRGPGGAEIDDATTVDMDPSGRFVVFGSERGAGETPAGGGCRIYRVDTAAQVTAQVSPAPGDLLCRGTTSVASDGAVVLTPTTDHVPEDTNGAADVYLVR